jgi:hypothetical protein
MTSHIPTPFDTHQKNAGFPTWGGASFIAPYVRTQKIDSRACWYSAEDPALLSSPLLASPRLLAWLRSGTTEHRCIDAGRAQYPPLPYIPESPEFIGTREMSGTAISERLTARVSKQPPTAALWYPNKGHSTTQDIRS